ncbi:TNF receptor superfamily member 18 [Turdus rufiventris]|nr:TNF receptor superfamily member 18 [Turdus rufiventris]
MGRARAWLLLALLAGRWAQLGQAELCQDGQSPRQLWLGNGTKCCHRCTWGAGVVSFRYDCKRCESGTYSSSRNSRCRKWTNCESSGLVILRAGNSTHDSVCGVPGTTPEPARVSLEFPSSTILAILTAVAVFVLILLTFLLHFCIWSFRGNKKFPAGGTKMKNKNQQNRPKMAPPALSGSRWLRQSRNFPRIQPKFPNFLVPAGEIPNLCSHPRNRFGLG